MAPPSTFGGIADRLTASCFRHLSIGMLAAACLLLPAHTLGDTGGSPPKKDNPRGWQQRLFTF